MKEHPPQLSSFRFKRAKTDGLIEVLNEGSYVMAEYSERTGVVKWQRMVLATQREKIEKYQAKASPDNPQHNATYAAMIESLDEGVGR